MAARSLSTVECSALLSFCHKACNAAGAVSNAVKSAASASCSCPRWRFSSSMRTKSAPRTAPEPCAPAAAPRAREKSEMRFSRLLCRCASADALTSDALIAGGCDGGGGWRVEAEAEGGGGA